jgi:hypothetical protein
MLSSRYGVVHGLVKKVSRNNCRSGESTQTDVTHERCYELETVQISDFCGRKVKP